MNIDPVAALEKLGPTVRVERNDQGEVVQIDISGYRNTRVTDAWLVHLKGVTNLHTLDLQSAAAKCRWCRSSNRLSQT